MKCWTITQIVVFFALSSIQTTVAAQPVINCIECHENLPAKLSQPVTLWRESIHSEHGIACNTCHGGDPIDIAQAMSPAKGFRKAPEPMAIPALCGSCHIGVTKYYMESAHGRALGNGGPTCVTCHGAHKVLSASLDLISKESCSQCHTFEKARFIRSAMSKRDTMLMAIEKKIKVLKSQGIETDQLEKRLFALRNRFHAMFHSLDVKQIIIESDHIQAEIEKVTGTGGVGTDPLTGAVMVGWALLAALLFYLIKKNVD